MSNQYHKVTFWKGFKNDCTRNLAVDCLSQSGISDLLKKIFEI